MKILQTYIKESILKETRIDQIYKPKVVGDDACEDCRGTGKYVGMSHQAEDCKACNGTGRKQLLDDDSKDIVRIINPITVYQEDSGGYNICVYRYNKLKKLDKDTAEDVMTDLAHSDYIECMTFSEEEYNEYDEGELTIEQFKSKYDSTHLFTDDGAYNLETGEDI